jgi:branched-subunit amino acid aminotransferase/4-amino-4-deoxychorismate lyase
VREKIFRIEDHLDRLYVSASSIYMTPPMLREELRVLLARVVEKNREAGIQEDLLLDVIFSGGLAGSTMKKASTPAHIYVAVQKLEHPPDECYETGVTLATFPYQRIHPHVKLLNYVGAVIAHQTVVPVHEAYDVLFVCPVDRKTVLEGSTFTVFLVDAKGTILTPPLDGRILDSVTRRVVLELLRPRTDFDVREAPVELEAALSYPEAFLVSTTRNVLPVTGLDDKIIGSGLPGPVTRSVMALFKDYIDSY